ncbi:vicilin-like seed storage protein At2g28490 [Castanea sativa]|uniref:vicilin-like seed storage protein At2g28490 n=1 Tax=Castanea sativa TaxID=21020 RepID=UPI003F64A05B
MKKMGNKVALLALVLVLCYGLAMAVSFVEDLDEDWRGESEETEDWRMERKGEGREDRRREREREGREEDRRREREGEGRKDWRREGEGEEEEEEDWRREREKREEWSTEEGFLLLDSKRVVKTDAGEMEVVRSFVGKIVDRPLHIGFITMEPKTLFIPQYLDSGLVIFIRRGEAKIGLIYKDELGERWLKTGDVYHIPAGSAFYLVNTAEGQKLHIICSIDPSEGLGVGTFQSFFIGGGTYPQSVLAGFEPETLSRAFNISYAEVRDLFRLKRGPIIYLNDSHSSSPWPKIRQMKEHARLMDSHEEPAQKEEQTWSWRKLLNSMLGMETENKKRDDRGTSDKGKGKTPDSYNLYDRHPDFSNDYGWSVALDKHDYSPLKHSGIGIYLVNLTAGAMMAPHVNPTATEYGIVLRGSGTIQIVFPNGTNAMSSEIAEGDVFFVPRYFPFCQIASRSGPLEFFGFTTSARKNRPQFLAGSNSLIRAMLGPELAASFGITLERLQAIDAAQPDGVILPPETEIKRREEPLPPDTKTKRREDEHAREPNVIKSFWE